MAKDLASFPGLLIPSLAVLTWGRREKLTCYLPFVTNPGSYIILQTVIFPRVSTASDKHWGEKARERGYKGHATLPN